MGLKHGPKRAPFETIYELGQVPGFSRQLLRSVLPLVTVHSHNPGVDPNAADPVLLAALARAQGVATDRGNTLPHSDLEVMSNGLAARIPLEFIPPSSHQAFAARAEIRTPAGGRTATEAILTLAEDSSGHIVREWRRVPAQYDALLDSADPVSLASCRGAIDTSRSYR